MPFVKLNPTGRAQRDLSTLRGHVQYDYDHAPDIEFKALCADKLARIDRTIGRLRDGWSPDEIRAHLGTDDKRWLPPNAAHGNPRTHSELSHA